MSLLLLPRLDIIPADAPFSPHQRRLLNAFFLDVMLKTAPPPPKLPAAAPPPAEESAPWKDPALDIAERMALAEGRPLLQRMSAAVAQQDCGQCGYLCKTYSEAIFAHAEPRLNLCVPGGKTTARMLKALVEEMGGGVLDPDEQAAKAAAAPKEDPGAPPGYSRAAPVRARFVGRRRLNREGSEKATCHIEIDLAESGLAYAVGDSLGILPRNPPALADAIIAAVDVPPDFPIAGEPLRDVLIERASLAPAPDDLFQLISYLTGGERRKKAKALARGEDPDGDAETLDVLAALQKFPGIRPDPEALIEVLEPLQPRLYSISSSPKTQPGRVTLTVDRVNYVIAGRERLGVASTYLGDRIAADADLLVYVQKAHAFGLPADGNTPIIMVGPGTGVAPFRAFLHERLATEAKGPAWLFFGHQRSACDFFYEEEWETLRQRGTLTNLSLAWSRDGAAKTYVQDKMREHGAELWRWLEQGAHFYVCGDAKRMARDVESALADIAVAHGGKSPTEAKAAIAALRQAGRYQADVY